MTLSLDGIECTSNAVAIPPVTKDFYVVSAAINDYLQVSILASSKMVNPTSAARILDKVCEAILSFSLCPNWQLSSLGRTR
jgi:hypothetical protein